MIYDLSLSGGIRNAPDADLGREACENARPGVPEQGNVGVGAGALVGKWNGYGSNICMKGGFGVASICCDEERGIYVVAVAAVNARGDVVDEQNNIIKGARDPINGGFLAEKFPLRVVQNAAELFGRRAAQTSTSTTSATAGTAGIESQSTTKPALPSSSSIEPAPESTVATVRGTPNDRGQNTTLVVIATNANLSKQQLYLVCGRAHDGMARAVVPVHTRFDGDAVYAVSTGEVPLKNVDLIGNAAALVTEMAIRNGVRSAPEISLENLEALVPD